MGKIIKDRECIVYMATSKTSGKSYVGVTSKGIHRRKLEHFWDASVGSSLYFHKAIRKYGREDFKWETLVSSSNWRDALVLEIFFIREFQTFKTKGYNLTKGGEGLLGHIHSVETRNKMSVSSKANIPNMERLSNLAKLRKGSTHSNETREKMSRAHKGVSLSEEHCKRIGEGHKGIIFSEERCKNISESLMGRCLSDEHCKAIGDSKRGVVPTQETKDKISNSNSFTISTPYGIFKGSRNASKQLGVPHRTISARCLNKRVRWKDWFYVPEQKGEVPCQN